MWWLFWNKGLLNGVTPNVSSISLCSPFFFFLFFFEFSFFFSKYSSSFCPFLDMTKSSSFFFFFLSFQIFLCFVLVRVTFVQGNFQRKFCFTLLGSNWVAKDDSLYCCFLGRKKEKKMATHHFKLWLFYFQKF